MAFTLKDTVAVSVGNVTVNVHSRVGLLWTVQEVAHTFHVTKSVLLCSVSLPSNVHIDINTFGHYTKASAGVAEG